MHVDPKSQVAVCKGCGSEYDVEHVERQVVGTWPYSFDYMDIARGVVPQAILGGVAGALTKKVSVRGAFGAASAALSRAQVWSETKLYPEEFKPEVLTPEFDQHNIFLTLLNAGLAGLGGAGLTALAKWALKE